LLPVIFKLPEHGERFVPPDLCADVDWNCSNELEHTRLSPASRPRWQANGATQKTGRVDREPGQ